MSRIGKKIIEIPKGVKVELKNNIVHVEGPKGKLEQTMEKCVTVAVADNQISISVKGDDKKIKALHGLTRALISNMVLGVVHPFVKKLEIEGVGYRVNQKGKDLEFSLGKSHPVPFKHIDGIEFKIPYQTHIEIMGINKQKVGQAAADIRSLYAPEPYKGKGIRYEGEYIRRKAGKSVK